MPYKSQAQRGKFHVLEKQGKISSKTVQHWDKESKGMRLPPRNLKGPNPSAPKVKLPVALPKGMVRPPALRAKKKQP